MEHLRLKHRQKTLREDSKILFGYVLSLYDRTKDEIVNRSTHGSPVYGSPNSNKRITTGLG